jgi:cytochrome c biogenesis protein ResB
MGLEMKVLRFYPHAQEEWKVEKADRPTALTTSALRLKYRDKESWLQLDDSLRVFGDEAAYVITYGHRRLDLGFDLGLKDFQMGTYPGTNRAASYESRVVTPDGGPDSEVTISMNEPLHYRGYTFYQASFQSGPDGKPNASILSVNKDPGRPLKYLGALIITLGIVYMFYDRRKAASAAALRAQGGKNDTQKT